MSATASEINHNLRTGAVSTERRKEPLRNCVQTAMRLYFSDLNGHKPDDVYRMVLSEVEQPLLAVVMEYTGGNQSSAAEILGINRSTLRKKLKQYGME